MLFHFKYFIDKMDWGRCGRDRMVVGFTTTYVSNPYITT